MEVFIGILALILSILFIIFCFKMALKPSRCPYCGKNLALVENDRVQIKQEKVSRLETHNYYNKQGKKTGSRECRVYGTRKYYQVNYYCKYCRKEIIRSEHFDIY